MQIIFHLNLYLDRQVNQHMFLELHASAYIKVSFRLVLRFDKAKTLVYTLQLIYVHIHTYADLTLLIS
jgi:hypothetical protein